MKVLLEDDGREEPTRKGRVERSFNCDATKIEVFTELPGYQLELEHGGEENMSNQQRPKLTIYIDDFTRMVTGFYINTEEDRNVENVQPTQLYTDNGKDFNGMPEDETPNEE